jgi:hypothetical protein
MLALPDEKEVLNDAFLTTHCIETTIDEENNALGLHFRPIADRRDFADVRGRIWIDAGSFQARRIEVEYVRDNKAFADAAVDYVDIPVGGKALRLPGPGTATLRPSGVTSAIWRLARATFTYTYDRIESIQR